MAYMSQEKKKEIVQSLKKAFGVDAKKRGFRYTVSVQNHSTINMTISKGTVDFLKDIDREYAEYSYTPTEKMAEKAKEIITKALACLNGGNHDNSDIMTDYFDVGWYAHVRIGSWDKPYMLEA